MFLEKHWISLKAVPIAFPVNVSNTGSQKGNFSFYFFILFCFILFLFFILFYFIFLRSAYGKFVNTSMEPFIKVFLVL